MAVRPLMDGVTLTACLPESDDLPAICSELATLCTWFRISSEGFTGFSAALAVFTSEDELEYYDESALLREPHL
jgi:hypothetical protein